MDELREFLNLIRAYANVLNEHHQVITPEELSEAAREIELQSERGLETLDRSNPVAAVAAGSDDAAPSTGPYGLSPRELEVLRYLATGMGDKQIAVVLGISTFTVSKHVSVILRKMNATSRTEAGVRAVRERIP